MTDYIRTVIMNENPLHNNWFECSFAEETGEEIVKFGHCYEEARTLTEPLKG